MTKILNRVDGLVFIGSQTVDKIINFNKLNNCQKLKNQLELNKTYTVSELINICKEFKLNKVIPFLEVLES